MVRKFIWGKEQNAFEEVKGTLQEFPVLHLQDSKGRFHFMQTLVNLPQEVHLIQYKMANQH